MSTLLGTKSSKWGDDPGNPLLPKPAHQTAATKVDRTQYDARAALISEKFERFRTEIETLRTEIKSDIRGALLIGLAWVTVLIGGLFAALK